VTTGSDITYTIIVTNNGAADAQSVVVTDNLSGSVSFVSCSANSGAVCGGSGNNRTITFSALASGSSAIITLVATANGAAGSTISNTATVSSSTPDANAGNNSASTTTTVQAPLPALSISDVTLNEGNSGTTTFSFTVSLSAPAPSGGTTFNIATQDNTALTANNDYIARSLMAQTIPASLTSYTFDVSVTGDTIVEPNETFFVNVSNVSGAAVSDGQGQGTIQNDDTANLVISQVYGGGGNSGAPYQNDFVEIFNRGTTTVDFSVTPYSVQYAGVGSNFGSNKTNLSSGVIAPGHYFLVQESGGTTNGTALPAPDATGTIAMGGTSGKVALVAGTTALAAFACPGDDGLVPFNPSDITTADFVGYGSTVSTAGHCYEGSGPAAAPSNTASDFRKAGGCRDTDDNAADFLVSGPFPRNSSAPVNNCVAGAPPSLSINDETVSEGNSGTTTATFTVSLSAPAPSTDITFDIATQDNTATTANSDYVTKSLTGQVIPAGQTTYSFSVTVNGDTNIEPNESFFVNVTNVTGATLTDGQGVGTIQNDDVPSLSINDVSLAEGNSLTKTFTFTVSLSAPAPSTVTFDIATQENTATVADNDYVAHSLTSQTITAGNSTYTFEVTVNGDTNIEPDESFFVNVTNISGATVSDGQGLGTILNDDNPQLTINDVTVTEADSGTTTAQFTVTLSPSSAQTVMVNYTTANNTAVAPGDYQTTSGTLTFTPGQTTQTIDVLVNGDTTNEAICETFFVNLTTPVNAGISDPQGVGSITDNDGTKLVISQIYGGGGNASATYTNDFIEIFNRGNTAVSLNGMSVQYAAATSTSGNYSVTTLPSVLLQPGQYFLIQESSGGANGIALPTAVLLVSPSLTSSAMVQLQTAAKEQQPQITRLDLLTTQPQRNENKRPVRT
jgi:uncharacterized repeat protein (TIGR01451 family)